MLSNILVFLADWGTFTFSMSNVIVMGWLGLTILLNSERRVWGTWLAGFGLLLGSAFFISHTAILSFGIDYSSRGLNFWWQIGLIPVIGLPLIWYVLILWYAGFWEDRQANLYTRQRWAFYVTLGLAISLYALLITGNPARNFIQVITLNLQPSPSLFGLPLLVLLYPLYIVACIGLSLDALRKPGPADRQLADVARQRARPWLIATSIALLLVSLLVAALLIYVFSNIENINNLFSQVILIAIFDFAISGLILLAAILIGEAITHYEIFTGKALPRRGLTELWRQALVLAVGFSAATSFAFILGIRQVYLLLGAILMMTAFFAYLNWQSILERQKTIAQLRPFVTNESLLDQLREQTNPNFNMQPAFNALCEEILNANAAFLIPWGALSPLVGPELRYPEGSDGEFSGIGELLNAFNSPAPIALALEQGRYTDCAYAVPLWNTRGKIGVLLLGTKKDGSIYTQEEIEIAQSSAERLIDTKASAEMAARLMRLQRERLAESQVIDQRTRRVLHDEVLQHLHTAMIQLDSNESNQNKADILKTLSDSHQVISNLLHDMPGTSFPELQKEGVVGALRVLLREEFSAQFDWVEWQVPDEREGRALSLLTPLQSEVTYYAAREAIRNAARHGRQTDKPLHLLINVQQDPTITITIQDNGRGLKLSQPNNDHDGRGLALHSTMMTVIGGQLSLESEPGVFTRVILELPEIR
jgi:signal transduction histidine kinase